MSLLWMPTEVDLLTPHTAAASDLTNNEINMEMWGRVLYSLHDILHTFIAPFYYDRLNPIIRYWNHIYCMNNNFSNF